MSRSQHCALCIYLKWAPVRVCRSHSLCCSFQIDNIFAVEMEINDHRLKMYFCFFLSSSMKWFFSFFRFGGKIWFITWNYEDCVTERWIEVRVKRDANGKCLKCLWNSSSNRSVYNIHMVFLKCCNCLVSIESTLPSINLSHSILIPAVCGTRKQKTRT